MEGASSDADVRFIVAQESGLKIGLGRSDRGRRRLGVYAYTVAVVTDMNSGDTFTAISAGTPLPTWGFAKDVLRTSLKPGGIKNNSIAETNAQRMARRG